ncbi:MAG: DUF1638 domain-containing protein [Rhodospirillales bacterium]|nr:DUF1638 domain-containing protein [Rhodospirillales bacterium]
MGKAAVSVHKPTLLIACGALAREVTQLIRANNWTSFELACLPADLHNKPQLIPDLMRRKIQAAKRGGKYARILVLYGDCGTGGLLDAVLEDEQVERIAGPHCYEFYATPTVFDDLVGQELGSFYLTDYLVRFFDRLIIQGLGIDRHPQLKDIYFGNYKRIVYLAQTEDAALAELAKAAATRLQLDYVYQQTGFGDLAGFLQSRVQDSPPWQA